MFLQIKFYSTTHVALQHVFHSPFSYFRFLFYISTYKIVFLRDCDTNGNIVKHKTYKERLELLNHCIKGLR